MDDTKILEGKKLLIADDELDVLETLEEMLDMCQVDTALSFEMAEELLNKETYDAAILDIMGINGYELLSLANQKGIPALMLTAHALSPDNLVKSIKTGAHSYVPKDKIFDIATFVADVFRDQEKGQKNHARWFNRLKPFFDKNFGSGWKEKDKEFWTDFDNHYIVSKEDVEKMM